MSELARVGNWVGEITATVGTGDLELGGAIDGFTTFQSIGEGYIYYAIVEGNNREAGKGVLYGSDENLFQRTDVYSTLVDGVYNNDNPDPIELNGLASVYCTFNERAFRELTQDALSVYYNNSVSGASSNSVGEALDELFNAPGAREFYKAKIEVTEGQTLLLLDSNFDSVILIVDGMVKQQTSGDYSVDYGNRSVILTEPLTGSEKVEAWVNQVEFVDAIKEAPVDGKPYARQDASWEEIVPVDSEFKMEDATDAERPFVGSVKGGSWDISLLRTVAGGLDLNNPSIPNFLVNQVTLEGDTLAASDVDGYLYDIYEDGSLILSNVIANAEDSGSTIVLGWEGATVPDGMSAPTSKIIEIRPGESNRQLLAENDVWAYNSAKGKFQPKQVASGSQGKMEDATDAELNSGVGFTWNEGAYTNTGEFASWSSSYGRFSTTDANGVQVDISALEGLAAKVFRDDLPVLDVVLVTGGGSYSNSIGWDTGGVAADGLSPIQDSIRIVPALIPPLPLKDGDVWSYNESEKKFKPTQIESESADFKMEDATDAELNTASPLDPNGYSWDRKIATNQQGGCQNDAVGIITNILDLNGSEIIPEDMNGQQFSIYMNEVLSLEDVTVTASQYSETTIRFGWGGYINSSSAVYKLVPYGLAKDALQDGDVWIFNAAEGKFKPTQIESGSTDPINNADILNPNDIGFDLFLIEDNTRVSKDPALNQGKDSSVRGVLANVTGKFQIRSYSRQPDTGTGELGMESQIGICDINFDLDTDASQSKNNWIGFTANNEFYRIRGWVDDTDTQIVQSVPLDKIQKDIPIDLLLDFDNGTFEVRIDGTQVGNVEAIPTGIEWYPYLTPQAGNDLSIDLTGDTFTPESGYKVWNTFIPSPGLTDFKMEDATDAELNSSGVFPTSGYLWDVPNTYNSEPGGFSFANDSGIYVKLEDSNGNFISEDFANQVNFNLYINGAEEPVARVLTIDDKNGYAQVSWTGATEVVTTSLQIVPVDIETFPLKDGDAWVYNEAESKFKPKPAVPTVVVTEFPETPDANTLYIKVV